jgi:hypothetical protein
MNYLAESQAQERAKQSGPRVSFTLTGPELMRAIESAVSAETRALNVSESEREALAQMVAETLLGKRERPAPIRRGSARDVLAYIARVEESEPRERRGSARDVLAYIARRESASRGIDVDASPIERGAVGRRYIGETVRGFLKNGGSRAQWRDVAATYQSAAERQSGVSRNVESVEVAQASDAGWLAQASMRESEAKHAPRPAPLPDDLRAIADAVAASEPDITRKQAASVRAAIYASLPDALPGTALAAELGCTYGTLRVRVSDGRKLLAARYEPAELASVIRATADALALKRGERSKVALGDAPALDARGSAALAATERVLADRKRDGSPQGAYSPATVRAARRNLRADRMTGRYGNGPRISALATLIGHV